MTPTAALPQTDSPLAPAVASTAATNTPPRLASLDAYRGFIMLILAADGFGLARAAQLHPDSAFWRFIYHEFEHVEWRGCGFWDLIQPAFMFMVGVAVPYSFASRKARGDSDRKIVLHSLWRSAILIGLGVLILSQRTPQTNWRFTNVLAQIGLGYTAVVLLRGRGLRLQLLAIGALLVGDWLLFALTPTAGAFASHWALRENVAHRFDLWFLNLFPTVKPFTGHEGGYQTLNFIPSLGTMVLGLIAGETLRTTLTAAEKLKRLVTASAICFAVGIAMDPSILPGVNVDWTLCPVVKRIWTPSWTMFSAGWTFAFLAAFYWAIDMRGWRRWSFPLVVVGMNSIAIYLMGQFVSGWVRGQLRVHFGLTDPIAAAAGVGLIFWYVCWWMYRRKIFLRI